MHVVVSVKETKEKGSIRVGLLYECLLSDMCFSVCVVVYYSVESVCAGSFFFFFFFCGRG